MADPNKDKDVQDIPVHPGTASVDHTFHLTLRIIQRLSCISFYSIILYNLQGLPIYATFMDVGQVGLLDVAVR